MLINHEIFDTLINAITFNITQVNMKIPLLKYLKKENKKMAMSKPAVGD